MSSLKQQGQVKDLMGDNGTNIVGAELEPKDALNGIDQNCITNFLSQHSSEWKFNLRSSRWMGDIWEAFIKSVQDTLKVVIQGRLFVDEMSATLMCEFVSILNQILIAYVSDDVNDYVCLTPNHFLVGKSNDFSSTKFGDQNINFRKKMGSSTSCSTNILETMDP